MNMKKLIGAAAVAALAVASIASPALADDQGTDDGSDLEVTAGTLEFDPTTIGTDFAGDFNEVTLNGTPQLTAMSVDPFTLIDATGAAAGWHVNITMADLSDGGTNTIDSDEVTMDAPVVTGAAGADMTNVTASAVDDAADIGAGVAIVSADVGAGAGTYLVSPKILKLTVPADTIAATYSSAVVIDLVTGPAA